MEIIKLYVLTDNEGYVTDYKFSPSPINGWKIADEQMVDEHTFFSKLVNSKFVLDKQKWDEYEAIVFPDK